MPSGNLLAPVALLLWLPLSLIAFAYLRSHVAATLTLLGASLLLPEVSAFDLPGLPPLGKGEIGCIAALLGTVFVGRRSLFPPQRGAWLLDLVWVALLAEGVATALVNRDPVLVGPQVSPGLELWEGVSTLGGDLILTVTPFLLGRALIRTRCRMEDLLFVIVGVGLAYSLLVLFEVRMSPKLHREIYGFAVEKAVTSRRLGGYRPLVFTAHGLVLATFMLSVLIAACGLWKARTPLFHRVPPSPIVAFLAFVFLVCRSVTQYVYAAVVIPVALLARPRVQMAVATAIAAGVFLYPVLRASNVIDTERVLELARRVDLPRVESLESRFNQEDLMLAKAMERPWLGWGGFGRRRVYLEEEGHLLVNDGFWIIMLGKRGILGYVAIFGLLLCPIPLALLRFKRLPSPHRTYVATLGLIVAVNALDLLPNGFYYPHQMFFSGALLGALQIRPRSPAEAATPDEDIAGTAELRDGPRPRSWWKDS